MTDSFQDYCDDAPDSRSSYWPSRDIDFTEDLLQSFAAEEEMVLYAEELPQLRLSLQTEFISRVETWERRREQLRQLPVTLSLMAIAVWAVLGGSGGRTDTNAMPEQTQVATRDIQSPWPHRFMHANIQTAYQNADSWAIVEAFQSDRDQRFRALLRGLGHVSRFE